MTRYYVDNSGESDDKVEIVYTNCNGDLEGISDVLCYQFSLSDFSCPSNTLEVAFEDLDNLIAALQMLKKLREEGKV